MNDEIKPRIDKHGVGWCLPNCLLWKSDGLTPACSFSYHTGSHICEPHARKAAQALKAMEVVRQRRLDIWWLKKLQVFRVIDDGSGEATFLGEAPDPADAILEAAETAIAKEAT